MLSYECPCCHHDYPPQTWDRIMAIESMRSNLSKLIQEDGSIKGGYFFICPHCESQLASNLLKPIRED